MAILPGKSWVMVGVRIAWIVELHLHESNEDELDCGGFVVVVAGRGNQVFVHKHNDQTRNQNHNHSCCQLHHCFRFCQCRILVK